MKKSIAEDRSLEGHEISFCSDCGSKLIKGRCENPECDVIRVKGHGYHNNRTLKVIRAIRRRRIPLTDDEVMILFSGAHARNLNHHCRNSVLLLSWRALFTRAG